MTNELDEKFAAKIPGVLEYHRLMLGDEPRNLLLSKTIESVVTPETSFLDIGAGSGAWAILAAKLGAKRVVAVEIEECLIPVIYKHAQENGVADRIEIIHGDCADIEIDGKYDVIVSELFSHDAFGAETVNAFVDIRERFLAAGGTLIPERLSLFAVPVRIESPPVPSGLDIKSDFLKSLRLNYAKTITRRDQTGVEFLGEPARLIELDFASITEPPQLTGLTASWSMSDVSRANGIATYNLSTFLGDLELDSRESQSWSLAVYQFSPFKVGEKTLSVVLGLDAENVNWTVSLPDAPEEKPQTYAPVFGFTRLRMAQQMTPHKTFSKPADHDA